MNIACADACCAINLINGNALEIVSDLSNLTLCIQGLVEDEIGEGYGRFEKLIAVGKIQLISGDDIRASEVSAVAGRYNIGLGESECIVIGKKYNCGVASDDRKARIAAESELGQGRIIGSVGLLKKAANEGLIDPASAYSIYQAMRKAGGFLPKVEPEFFK